MARRSPRHLSRPLAENPGLDRLRDHLRHHNRWVLLLAVLTFVVSAALWTGLYFVVWWLFLLGGTVTRPLDFHPAAGALIRGFATVAILLCFAALIVRRVRPNIAPQDHKSIWEHLLDLLLAVPRVTLSIFGTGRATTRLTDRELRYAWHLLRHMDEAGIQLPVHSLPVEIPDSEMRNKIILALQLGGLIEIRGISAGPVLTFRNKAARELAQDRVRLRL